EDDVSLPVKIQGAGIEPFELQVSRFWQVQELSRLVLSREEVSPRTCLSLTLGGATLHPLAELGVIEGLKPGTTIKLIEEPYSLRAVQSHLAQVQKLLRAGGVLDSLREGHSPSCLNTVLQGPTTEATPAGHNGRSSRRPASDARVEPPADPPEYVLPGSRERPLLWLQPSSPHTEAPPCLLDLSLSRWNPPPGNRKLQGDLLYLSVCTLEGRRCDITSCPKGFYLNQSTVEQFDSRPASPSLLCHCLADLLSQLSPGFKKGLAALRSRPQRLPLEMMATPYRTLSWLAPPCPHRPLHDPCGCRLGLDGHTPAQTPDWNEELQAARDLPQSSREERLLRAQALLQVNSGFVWAAAQAAQAVIDGCVAPINASEDPHLHAFMWGGVFLSRGGETGRVAGGLHTLPTAVVDYRGVRLAAQGLAPGSLEEDGGTRLLYGLSVPPQEGTPRRRLLELLAQAAKGLGLQKHSVLSPRGHAVPLFSSTLTRGLLGADGRFYITDLSRSLPPDANFHPGAREEGWPLGYSSLGLPRLFPHHLCRLRPELVSAFIQHKSSQFKRCMKERVKGKSEGEEECTVNGEQGGVETVRAVCKELGSVSDIIFEIRFNPDIYSPGVQFPQSESGAVRVQERLLREAAVFLVTKQIPAFVADCLQRRVAPLDGSSLTWVLHQRGINIRYLGKVVRAVHQSQHSERLTHITRLLYSEMVVRSARRILNSFLQGVEMSSLSAAVCHFLCCLLGLQSSPAPVAEEPKRRSRRRGRGVTGGVVSDSMGWSMLSGAELWCLISLDARETYDLEDDLGSSIDHLVEQYKIQKLSVLRELCLKTGIQLQLREYSLDSRHKPPITPDDILNIFPVIKHLTMTTADASQVLRSAEANMQKGQLLEAYEQLKEAVFLFTRVCDDLHPEACACLSLLARVAHILGHSAEARSVQIKAVLISERVLGFDHPNTIQQYAVLAVYVCAGGESALARRLLYRARLLLLVVHGEEHPYTATLDSSIGLLLQGELSLQFLRSALRLNTKFCGNEDLQTALSHHLLAQALCTVGEYRSAVTHEREALAVYQEQLGDDHQRTRVSSDFLRAITQQAVRVERSLRQGGDPVDIMPPQ
ncbi:CLU protein, partial [Amia calva]|nr:CLU protein [Amia calva]